MATLLITSGLPGSGKTQFIKSLDLPPGRVFSPDNVLMRSGRYVWSPESVAQAWRTEYCRYGRALQLVENAGDHVILAWDATFTNSIGRCPIINTAKGALMQVDGLFFDTPLSVCIKRNAARTPDRRVPEDKIRKWADALEEPRLHEGYDSLLHVTPQNCQQILNQYLRRAQKPTQAAAGMA